ncbi:hypothetical protein PCANC_11681 [Puccinia coronata f. sp. avenae]|uniref:Uncharacterized protein n=1 Tax=Puccinia coronata f. sp. avenae TaxID=200324 RepID=A0A2N5VXI7_9BASI|nr:hypothetical protein PCANC_11681 [Puccinia coronata f. sp. avenae]
MSKSDNLDPVINQPQAKAAERNLINGSVWTPIATGPQLSIAKTNQILNKPPVTSKPTSVPKRCSRCLSQAKKKASQGTGKIYCAKNNSARKLLDSNNIPLAAETSLSTMSSANPQSNNPDYSSNGLSTEQLVAALDHEPAMELDNLLNLSSTLPPNMGVNPSLINSRGASQAIESNRSTSVPAPIERLGASNNQHPMPKMDKLACSIPQKTYSPQGSVPAINHMKEETETMMNIIDGQWALFLKEHSLNDTSLMKTTLSQAHSSQLLLQRAVALPALTGRTRQFKRCLNSHVRLVVGQALSNQSTCRRVGQACPISSWDRSHRTSRDRSDKSVRPVGSCFGRTVPVQPPVEHSCSSTARTTVFNRLMPAV